MQSIQVYARALLSVLIGTGAVLILLPITLVWLLGLVGVIVTGVLGAAISAMEMKMPSGFLGWAWVSLTMVLLPGYGLISLWWMVFSHRTVTFREVPKKIWLGLVLGSGYAVFFSGLQYFTLTASPPFIAYENRWGGWTQEFYFGAAPLLILGLVLFAMWLRGRDEASKVSAEEQMVNP